jgi:hypothetical protein
MKENHKQQVIKAGLILTLITPLVDIQCGIYFGILTIALNSVFQLQKPPMTRSTFEMLQKRTVRADLPVID